MIETVMFPYSMVERQGESLIALAKEKNVGFIAMKPLAGGAIEDATLAMRYIVSNPDVTVEMVCAAGVTKLYRAGIVGGDAGTGKSSSVKAVANSDGKRVIVDISENED